MSKAPLFTLSPRRSDAWGEGSFEGDSTDDDDAPALVLPTPPAAASAASADAAAAPPASKSPRPLLGALLPHRRASHAGEDAESDTSPRRVGDSSPRRLSASDGSFASALRAATQGPPIITSPPRAEARLGGGVSGADTRNRVEHVPAAPIKKLQLDGDACQQCGDCSHFRPTAINPDKCECKHRRDAHIFNAPSPRQASTPSPAAAPVSKQVPKIAIPARSSSSSNQPGPSAASAQTDGPRSPRAERVVVVNAPSPRAIRKEPEATVQLLTPAQVAAAIDDLRTTLPKLEACVLKKSDAGLARDLLKQLSAQIAHANSLCARADDKIICNLWVVQSYLGRFEAAVKADVIGIVRDVYKPGSTVPVRDVTAAFEKCNAVLGKIPPIK